MNSKVRFAAHLKGEASLRIRPVPSAATSPTSNEISCFQATALGIDCRRDLLIPVRIGLACAAAPSLRADFRWRHLRSRRRSHRFPFLLLLPSFRRSRTFFSTHLR
jgi:hypothetical protein